MGVFRWVQYLVTILGTSRSRMQQPVAACTRAQSLTRPCPCATCNWLLHPAPTSVQDGLDPLQLVLVVFFRPSINAIVIVGVSCIINVVSHMSLLTHMLYHSRQLYHWYQLSCDCQLPRVVHLLNTSSTVPLPSSLLLSEWWLMHCQQEKHLCVTSWDTLGSPYCTASIIATNVAINFEQYRWPFQQLSQQLYHSMKQSAKYKTHRMLKSGISPNILTAQFSHYTVFSEPRTGLKKPNVSTAIQLSSSMA